MKNNSTMKNLSKFNLLIIILLFSSCRQQPFTGTVHIIPYPNQIAIGTQYIDLPISRKWNGQRLYRRPLVRYRCQM